MIQAVFFKKNGRFSGFRISGHAGFSTAGNDVVCASVSSAVQLMINTLDVLGFLPIVETGDNVIRCKVICPDKKVSDLFGTLKLHFESVVEEFPETIKITIRRCK